MVNFKDIILNFSLPILWMISTILLVRNGYDLLPFVTIVIFVYLKIWLKRSKKILPYVKNDFEKLGFEIMNERPSKLSEMKYEMSLFQVTINGTPIGRFKFVRQFYRIFKAKNKEDKIVLLNTIVTKKWNGENHIEIIKIKNVS